MADGDALCADLSDIPELSALPDLRSVESMSPYSPFSDLFSDAEMCIAELSPMSDLLLPPADLCAVLDLAMLDTSRELVMWAGTAVGGGDVKSLRIRNSSSTETMSLSLELADGAMFQFQSQAGQKPGGMIDLTFLPGSESYVGVMFCPMEVACYRDSVLIRQGTEGAGLAAVIPLCGYGGASQIQVSVNSRMQVPGAPLGLTLDMTASDGSRLAGLMVNNGGPRAAYVRVVIFTDASCQQEMPDGLATALPCRFVVPPGQSQQLTVAAPAQQQPNTVPMLVSVLCGDELLRRELRHTWPTGAPAAPRTPQYLQLNHFQDVFDGEQQEPCPDLPLGVPQSKLDDMFFLQMRQTKLPLTYPEKPVAGAAGPSARSRLQELQSVAVLQPRTVTFGYAAQSTSQLSPQGTSPTPDLIKPGASPSRAVGASPGRRGASPSRPKSSPRKRGPPAPQPPPPPPQSASAVSDDDWWPDGPGVEQLVKERGRPRLHMSTNHLMFPLTALGIPSEASLQLTNAGDDPLSWNMFGYSMPYLVKGAHPDKMKKCGYDVFKIRPKEGEVAPGQTISLQVRFSPPYPGKLTQHFQLLAKPAKETPGQPMVVYTVPVRVSGRGSVLDDGEDEADLLNTPLHVSEDTLFFGHWSICHKLDITNKTGEDLDVEYDVAGPFKVVSGPNERSLVELTKGRMLAPSQRYVQMSVYFCPEVAGVFSGELQLWLNHAPWRHHVRLDGACDDADALRQSQLAGEL